MSEPDRLKLIRQMMPAEFVVFDHNPTKLTVLRRTSGNNSRSSTSSSGGDSATGGAAGTLGAVFHGTDPLKITVPDAILDGQDTKRQADMLLSWLSPSSGVMGAVVGAIAGALNVDVNSPPVLIVQWGPPSVGIMITATLLSCTVTYTRFGADGIPTRAKIKLDLSEVPSPLGAIPTNPTSGGQPGRTRKIVAAGDTLASIAQASFGDPAAWRPIAAINSIDNPAAISPGDVIYLPNRDELAGDTR